MTYLPGVLAEIAEIAGEDAAIAIARCRGGTRVYIPAQAPDGHWLVACVGRDAADAICRHFSTGDGRATGTMLILPLGPSGTMRDARRRLARSLAGGASASAAALEAGLSERTVWRLKARIRDRKNSDQGELF